ncbi:MAG TPA: hypothetical protein VFP83_07440 [Candidatus Limnocylindria bacterium]|nr:hypothetical protein [Candidatus Limnocylindria bacterium]
MTELLTESFCERCGTRFDLGNPEPMSRTQKTRGLMTGLRQFIMSTDSLADSLNDGMRAEEEQVAARQIDAFQETFNFCFDCRRYTCVSCWNDDAGRCRSCVPVPGIDDIAGFDERLAHPLFLPEPEPEPETPMLTTAEAPAWPAQEGVAPALAWPSEDGIVAPVEEPVEEPIAAAADADEAPAEEPEITLAAQAEGEDVEPVEELFAASAEEAAEPPVPFEPPLSTAPKRDLRDTFVRGPLVPRQPASTEPVPESLAARRSQLDKLGIDDPGEGTVSIGQRDALPYRSSGAGSAANSTALAAVWDASTRYLESGAQRASVRPCGACGLTVSATARFCRRCGAPQTLSA